MLRMSRQVFMSPTITETPYLDALFVQEGEDVLGCVRPITFKRLD
jgi:hypothetical protein